MQALEKGAAAMAMAAAAAAFALGVWQYGRLGEQRELTRVAREALAAPPAGAAQAASWPAGPPAGVAMVSLEGLFSEETLLVRSHHHGAPGFRVVGLFAPAGWEHAVLVDRGWVPEGYAVEALPPGGPVSGLALTVPEREGALLGDGIWRHLSPQAMAAGMGRTVASWIVVVGVETDLDKAIGAPPVTGWTLPVRSTAHAQYAVTWFSLGLVALAFGAALLCGKARLAAEG
ncbi:SURF1 family protein [bacterium]|nr:SURF1 family protein [bacterium]